MRPSRLAAHGMVSSIDHIATGVGVDVLRDGGSAADAAIATSAVLAVTAPFACGIGGDLFAVVKPPGAAPIALNATGRSGSGADPDRLRAEGARVMPLTGDIRSVTVPGCVDGWLALHDRFGTLPLSRLLEPARLLAADGFAASVELAATAPQVVALPAGGDLARPGGKALRPGDTVVRPGMARALAAIIHDGRDGFYGGPFGAGLVALGAGEFDAGDLEQHLADWVPPASLRAWGLDLWTVPPNSQGYLTLSGAWIASQFDLGDPRDGQWAHLLVEAARVAGRDRPDVLWEGATAESLLDPLRLASFAAGIDPDHARAGTSAHRNGGTIHLCAVDADRGAVSMTQSNAKGFGSLLAVDGIFLHDRGLGFSLVPGHLAEYAPGRRPPHTLSPAIATAADGALHTVVGTMGGDTQPQILLQLLARIAAGESAAAAVDAGRWALLGGIADPDDPTRPISTGFDTWDAEGPSWLRLEGHVAPAWPQDLSRRGHRVVMDPAHQPSFGHAHIIRAHDAHFEGASDPRAPSGAAAGW